MNTFHLRIYYKVKHLFRIFLVLSSSSTWFDILPTFYLTSTSTVTVSVSLYLCKLLRYTNRNYLFSNSSMILYVIISCIRLNDYTYIVVCICFSIVIYLSVTFLCIYNLSYGFVFVCECSCVIHANGSAVYTLCTVTHHVVFGISTLSVLTLTYAN